MDFDDFDWGAVSKLLVALEVLPGYVVAVELLQTDWLEFHGAEVAEAEAVIESWALEVSDGAVDAGLESDVEVLARLIR